MSSADGWLDLITPQAMQRIIMMDLQGLGRIFGLGGPRRRFREDPCSDPSR